jgi:hypothetical protein
MRVHLFALLTLLILTTNQAFAWDENTGEALLNGTERVHDTNKYLQFVEWARDPLAANATRVLDRFFDRSSREVMDYEFSAMVSVLRMSHIRSHPSFSRWANDVKLAADLGRVDYVPGWEQKPQFPEDLRAAIGTIAADTSTQEDRKQLRNLLDSTRRNHVPAAYTEMESLAQKPTNANATWFFNELFSRAKNRIESYEFDTMINILRIDQIKSHPNASAWAAVVKNAAESNRIEYLEQYEKPRIFPADLLSLVVAGACNDIESQFRF